MTIKILNALIAIVAGVGGALVLYYLLNKLAELLPGRWEDRIKPYVSSCRPSRRSALFLIYPAIQTIVYSFANRDSTAWVGLDELHRAAESARTSSRRCSTRCCGSSSCRPSRWRSGWASPCWPTG